MTLSGGLIAAVALIYMAILFAIAFYGDRSGEMSPRLRAWVYSLSLAVWCTSWTFFGSVGQAAEQLWAFVPIYLGPILLMLFAPHVIQKMIVISKQEHITSIADFIAARYGKSQLQKQNKTNKENSPKDEKQSKIYKFKEAHNTRQKKIKKGRKK